MRRPEDGFTLIELIVIVTLLAIVVTIALPNFALLIRDNRVQSQAEEMNSLLQYARSEAVIRKLPVTVSMTDGKIEVKAGSKTLRVTSLQLSGVTFAHSASDLTYRPNGTASVLNYSAVFCRDQDPATGYLLTVAGSGSTTLHPRGKNATGNDMEKCSL